MSPLFSKVFNRGVPPQSFLDEMIAWAKSAPNELFAPNAHYDIFNKVNDELGPFPGATLLHRKATLLEVMRVLALFESGCKWTEGIDASRSGGTNTENAEAGFAQVCWSNRRLDPSLAAFLAAQGIRDGAEFQRRMKHDHPCALSFTALLLRIDIRDYQRINNGPILKGAEREATWPQRPKLWAEQESIYPWLSRSAVAEFERLLS